MLVFILENLLAKPQPQSNTKKPNETKQSKTQLVLKHLKQFILSPIL